MNSSSNQDDLLNQIPDPPEFDDSDPASKKRASDELNYFSKAGAAVEKLRKQSLENDATEHANVSLELQNNAMASAILVYRRVHALRERVASKFTCASWWWLASLLVVLILYAVGKRYGFEVPERLVLAYIGLTSAVFAFFGGFVVWLFPRNEKPPLELVLNANKRDGVSRRK